MRILVLARGACVEQYGTGEAYLPFLDVLGSLLQSPWPGTGGRAAAAGTRPHGVCSFQRYSLSGAMEQLLREATRR